MEKKANKNYRFTKIGLYYSFHIDITQLFKRGRRNYLCNRRKFRRIGRSIDIASLGKKTSFKI